MFDPSTTDTDGANSKQPWGIEYLLEQVWQHIERGSELMACQLLFPTGMLVGIALPASESSAFVVLHRMGRHVEALELADRLLHYFTADPQRLLWHYAPKILTAYGWALQHNGNQGALYLCTRAADLLAERRLDELEVVLDQLLMLSNYLKSNALVRKPL